MYRTRDYRRAKKFLIKNYNINRFKEVAENISGKYRDNAFKFHVCDEGKQRKRIYKCQSCYCGWCVANLKYKYWRENERAQYEYEHWMEETEECEY